MTKSYFRSGSLLYSYILFLTPKCGQERLKIQNLCFQDRFGPGPGPSAFPSFNIGLGSASSTSFANAAGGGGALGTTLMEEVKRLECAYVTVI